MKRTLLFLALCPLCVAVFLLSCPPPASQAQTSFHDIYVGSVGSTAFEVSGGPPNGTVVYNITQSSPGVMGYALEQPALGGPWADSLAVPVSLDADGKGLGRYYFYGKSAGASDQNTCSVQLGCLPGSPIHWTVTPPASGSKLQYQKDGVYVDVPATLNVLRNDVVNFKAIPLPAGSRFYPNDPTWGGTSGATGQGPTTAVTFSTASRTTKDYKTVTANVQISTVAGGATTTANVIVADGVTSLSFEPIDPASVIDDNPNDGGGRRVFPDKNSPGDTVNRRRVRVKAVTSFAAGQAIFFKSFDLDDPSANAAPVDANASAGNDNRGGSGTAQQFGILSAVGATGTGNAVSATTDANGHASVDLTVTMQPGDNFMVAASHDQRYLNGLTVSGITLRDSAGLTVGAATAKAKASPMLTVWRRLHVEIDSMEAPPLAGAERNSVVGRITAVSGTSTMATRAYVDQNLDDGSPQRLDAPAPDTGNGRFERGRIRIGAGGGATETSALTGNGASYVQKDIGPGIVIPCSVSQTGQADVTGSVLALAGNVFTVNVASGALTSGHVGGTITVAGVGMTVTAVNPSDASVTVAALADIPFELVDDDAAPLPQLPDTSLMEAKYKPAYILPAVDGGGHAANIKTSVPFKLNLQADTNAVIDSELRAANALESDGNRADNFWVVYIMAAYQARTYSPTMLRGDNDPDAETALGGVASGNDLGAFIFVEELRDEEQELTIVELAATVAHESAHQFGLLDCGSTAHPCDTTIHDFMGGDFNEPDSRFSASDLNILRSRIRSPGR